MSTWRLSSDDNGTFRGAIFRLRRSVDAGRGNERRRRRAVTATDDANHRAVAALSLTRSDAIRPPGRPLRSRPADICNACRPFSSGPTRSALGRSGWRRTRSDQLVGRSLRRVRTSRYGTCDVLQCGFFNAASSWCAARSALGRQTMRLLSMGFTGAFHPVI